MPGPFAQRIAGRSGRASRFLIDWNADDGLNDDGIMQARTGALLPFTRGGTVGSAYTRDAAGLFDAVGAQQPRFSTVYDAVSGLYVPGLLLAVGRQNKALGSNLFANDTYWNGGSGVAGFTSVTAAASCIRGQQAWVHNAAAGNRSRAQGMGVFTSGTKDCAWIIFEPGTCTQTQWGLYNATDGNFAALGRIQGWNTTPAFDLQIDAGGGAGGLIALGGGRYLLWVTHGGTTATAKAMDFYIYPTGQLTGTATIHHAEFSPGRHFPSAAPIVTVGAAVTRSDENPAFDFNYSPTDFTLLLRGMLPCTTNGKYGNLLSIGDNSSVASAELYVINATAIAEIRGTPNTPTAAQTISTARSVDIVAQYRNWLTGPSCALDIGAGFGAWSAASDAKTGFANPRIRLNSGSNGPAEFVARALRVAAGLQTRAYMMAA